MPVIFQDPYGSLNPRRRVGSIIADPLAIRERGERRAHKRTVQELMELVGLNPEHYNRFPAAFAGGQRQRIGIARALALDPDLIICDEPVSALDVSIQAQVINLLLDLQRELGLTYVFITHDLSVVRHVSDRIAVMYLGKVVEVAPPRTLFEHPRHPHTAALLSARPVVDADVAPAPRRVVLGGEVPSPLDPPSGCRFHPRCPKAESRCRHEEPQLQRAGPRAGEQGVACHFPLQDGELLTQAATAPVTSSPTWRRISHARPMPSMRRVSRRQSKLEALGAWPGRGCATIGWPRPRPSSSP